MYNSFYNIYKYFTNGIPNIIHENPDELLNFLLSEKADRLADDLNIDGINDYNVVSSLYDFTLPELEQTIVKLDLVKDFEEHLREKYEKEYKVIEDGWKIISNKKIDEYVGKSSSLLNLKNLLLFFRITEEDVLGTTEESFSDSTLRLLDLIDPRFNKFRFESPIAIYYDFVFNYFLSYFTHIENSRDIEFDIVAESYKLQKVKWNLSFSCETIDVYFGDSTSTIMVVLSGEETTIVFVQHKEKYIYIFTDDEYYFSLQTNSYYTQKDDGIGRLIQNPGDLFTILPSFLNDESIEYVGPNDYLYSIHNIETELKNLSGIEQQKIKEIIINMCRMNYPLESIETALNFYKEKDFSDAIRYTVTRGRLDVLKLFLRRGIKLENINRLLSIAIYGYPTDRDSLDMIKYLIDNGADINYQDGHYGTPLYKAIPYHKDTVRLLISLGADVNGGAIGIFHGFDSCLSKAKRNLWVGTIFNMLLNAGAKE